MKKKLYHYAASPRTALWLLILYAVLLAAATFIEKYTGTGMARALVYHSPFFFLLNILLVVNFILSALQNSYIKGRRWALLVTHLALAVMLAGATVTHFFSYEGILHIREGERSDQLVIREDPEVTRTMHLPFSVELTDFILSRYPGSSSPSFYESEVIIHREGRMEKARIYMNNVLNIDAYRIYQASYDKDEKGTVLLVNHDRAGRSITYAGYLLLLAGLILTLFSSGSRFAALKRQLKLLSLLLFFFLGQSVSARDFSRIPASFPVDGAHAAAFGHLYMQADNGRIVPVNTFSSEVLRKLHKETSIAGMDPDQFLLSLLSLPDLWVNIPFISNTNDQIAGMFGLSEKYCAFREVFNEDGSYKLQEKVEEVYAKQPAERNRLDKDLLKLDEKMNLFNQLINAQRLSVFPRPGDENHRWYAPGDDLSRYQGKDSMFVTHVFVWYLDEIRQAMKSGEWGKADEVLGMVRTYQQAKAEGVVLDPLKLKAEYIYNKVHIFRYCRMAYLIFGGILLLVSMARVLGAGSRWKRVYRMLSGLILLFFVLHAFGIGLRWYISGYAPWSNSYETMVYVAWTALLAGLVFKKKSKVTFALSAILGGVLLFVSGLNWMDPQINPLVPVLKSPWLMFHVAVIVASYGFLGISAFMGLTNQILMCLPERYRLGRKIRELSVINEMSLWIGLCLLITGTFLGAVWANESWGRYWGWDPKETWALITIVVYVAVTHLHLVKKVYNSWLFNLLTVLAFSSVLMTFFGVNYFLSGMHSYGENDGIGGLEFYLVVLAAILLIAGVSYHRQFKKS